MGGERNILPSVNSLSYILMAFQQYKLFVPMKTGKNVTLSDDKHGKVKLVIQTFKFAFLNTNGKIKTVLIFLSGQPFPSQINSGLY